MYLIQILIMDNVLEMLLSIVNHVQKSSLSRLACFMRWLNPLPPRSTIGIMSLEIGHSFHDIHWLKHKKYPYD